MRKALRGLWVVFAALLIVGCAGAQRNCASNWAKMAGSDWLIVQYEMSGSPIFCWALKDVSIGNEENSDGIFWKDSRTGHLIHLSGWYNMVQVSGGDFESAARLIGADERSCN